MKINEIEQFTQKYKIHNVEEYVLNQENDYTLKDSEMLYNEFLDHVKKDIRISSLKHKIQKLKSEIQSINSFMSSMRSSYSSQMKSEKVDDKYQKSFMLKTLSKTLLDNETLENKYLNRFIDQCVSSSIKNDGDPFYNVKNVQLFIEEMTEMVLEQRPDIKLEKKEIYEGIEKALFSKVYSICLRATQDLENDDLVSFIKTTYKLKVLQQSIKYGVALVRDLLHIQDVEKFTQEYFEVIELLKGLPNHHSPSGKLLTIYCGAKRVLEIIENNASQQSNKNDVTPITTDDFLPVFICVIAHATLKDMFSQIAFIKKYAIDTLLLGEQGYYFSSFESAAYFIKSYKAENKENS